MISLRNLDIKTSAGLSIVTGVSFNLAAGQCLAIVGESGAGKSLTAKALLGLLPRELVSASDSFTILGLNANKFTAKDWRKVRGRQIGYISQDALVALDPLRRVQDEVAETLLIHGLANKSEARSKSVQLLAEQNLDSPTLRAKQYPGELSGGMRQRALIASVLSASPKIIIADEPTASLDTVLAAAQLAKLQELKDSGLAVILISHDLQAVAQLADQVIVLQAGQVIEEGEAKAVFENPKQPLTQELLAAGKSDQTAKQQNLPDQSEPILQAISLSKSYANNFIALSELSFSLSRGSSLGIVGASGAGKSSLAKILLAVQQPSSGTVRINGSAWSDLSERQRRGIRRQIQLVPQDPLSSFDPRFRVDQIIAEGLPGKARKNSERVLELLTQVGLAAGVARLRSSELSGGQRQRVAIARALAMQPKILVCDEAVSALDVTVRSSILQLLTKLREELALSIVFISHDLGVVRNFCDQILVLHQGKIVESGPTLEIFEKPKHPATKQLISAARMLYSG